ncbi:hypothetical protein M378DRAFT_171587 [Amanita muscaria Koide BX008]|uniref:F-box domain-containing protein n=1 Tax=Amanita muscaria (strain Koide BX008) TaxID=946122 RepID=A0A0C2W8U0_AMAMK|nr:hypothetical protein M378DRAFT_171587 [Amanita muscaria Koide BX008]
MAVVSEIPNEILTEIFYLLCKKPIYACELNNSCHKEDFPWAVGLVCRQWRTPFLSYPPIWASLTLSDDYFDDKSYAKEVNRRLALYLKRSGGHPLRLDISVWSDYNKAFTMMALEMLSACSHRWQTAKFELFCDWASHSIHPCKGKLPTLEWLKIRGAVDRNNAWDIFEVAPRLTHAYIEPWAKDYGWILPWTQLTELTLTINEDSVIETGDVPNFLPMLHNIKEFRFCNYGEMDFEGDFPRFAPAPLNQLRVLEVPHPAVLSWFEAPSLREIYFTDCQDYDEPLDVHEQISSLIERSSCRIRKLSFESGRKFYVGTLKDVEELVIDYSHSRGVCPSIDISSLPKLRLLTIICSIDEESEDLKSLMNSLTTALKSARVPTRSECSSGTPTGLLERVTVELYYDQEQPKIPDGLLKIADEWPVVVFRTLRS